MKKILLLAAIVAVAAGFFVLRSQKSSDITGGVSPMPTATPRPSPSESEAPAGENIITLTDAGFSPSTLTIKKGETVVFKNNSSGAMWVASAMHPTHDVYPIKGGCVSSIFDQCEAKVAGGSWSFKFDIAGTWKYHNHRNSDQFGMVVVK